MSLDAHRSLYTCARALVLLAFLVASAWSAPVAAQYCPAPTTDPSDGFLDGFFLNGERRTDPAGNAGYFDGTAQPAVSVAGGQTYSLEIFMVAPPGAGQYDYELVAWVDYNNDQDFNDAGELEGSINLLMSGGAFSWSFTFTLDPPNGVTGTRRMRLVMIGDPSPGPAACPVDGFVVGETEDWTLDLASTQVCGNGVAEGTEDCDLGAANGNAGNCCSASCTFRGAGTACTDDGLECTNDVCGGSSAVCTHPNRVGSCTDDGNVCTNDVCSAGVCTHPNNTAPCTSDGIQCTNDICAAGSCTHPPFGTGTPCGSPADTACSNPDTCDGAGACLVNNEASGFACGDPSDTACTNPDTCDGGGTCLVNHETSGFPCGSPNDDECTDPDTCNGSGVCLANHAADLAPCGDPSTTDCTNPDSCAAGVCQPRHIADDTPCTGDGNECTADLCTTGVCSHPNFASGTPCGSTSDTDCTDPDSCNGSGVCLANHENDGAACTSDGIECTADTCEGGACAHPNLDAGSPCGDPTDGDCTNPDTCDGSGSCLINDEPDETICSDDGSDCTTDLCAGGVCEHPALPLDTACGDPADTDCTDPDTCDASGNCLGNHEIDGSQCTGDGNDCTGDICAAGLCSHPNHPVDTTCGDGADTDCTAADTCDGSGACLGNHVPAGTACGDASDTECTDADACDPSGTCAPNHELDGTACTSDDMFCSGIESCRGGVCASAGNPCDEETQTCDEAESACVDRCGNGLLDSDAETCDDGNLDTLDGCSATCEVEPGWTCDEDCVASCGDGAWAEGAEACDDGNEIDGDGCSAQCGIEAGWDCSDSEPGEPADCVEVCGDGTVVGAEQCDDENEVVGDGCFDCLIEPGWVCDDGEPSQCELEFFCGNGRVGDGEDCDDGNESSGDGCSASCDVEPGWMCDELEPSLCLPDGDDDDIHDQADNCPAVANTDQRDMDGDGDGDACDEDIDGDGLLNDEDQAPFDPTPVLSGGGGCTQGRGDPGWLGVLVGLAVSLLAVAREIPLPQGGGFSRPP